jgi:DNA-binding MarR family transcriptional regulator
MQHIELPKDYSVVLQEVNELGEEDVAVLAETLNFDRGRLFHILHALQHKGLISFSDTSGRGVWVRLSAKGRKFVQNLWPESSPGLAYGY